MITGGDAAITAVCDSNNNNNTNTNSNSNITSYTGAIASSPSSSSSSSMQKGELSTPKDNEEWLELPEDFAPSKMDVIVGWARQNYHHGTYLQCLNRFQFQL
jgi:hypothetical protein